MAAGADAGSPASRPWELVRPSVTELAREVRTNIPCTVTGCGKVLPNPPALNMHLVKSHGVQDGIVNPTIRKNLKTAQKLYCCPIEGCPRGPNRPFSQFSLVKQHFMKMHAEKKHKCDKCKNSYGTEWDLKRHAGYCGKTFQCTCGCPYTSRTALLSHIHRTGHEIPAEHRDPPVKKRKMEGSVQNLPRSSQMARLSSHELFKDTSSQDLESSELAPMAAVEGCSTSSITEQILVQPKHNHKLLLPKPKMALIKLPVMQFAHVPVIVSVADHSVNPIVVAVDNQGSVMSSVHVLPQTIGILMPSLDTEAFVLEDTKPVSKLAYSCPVDPVNTCVQVDLDNVACDNTLQGNMCHKNRIASINVQTDLSYVSQNFVSELWPKSEPPVSSCSQTDLTFSARVSLPISAETQTWLPDSKIVSSVAAQTDAFENACCPLYAVSKETQTGETQGFADHRVQVDQAVMCNDIFNIHPSYTVSTQTSLIENTLITESMDQSLLDGNIKALNEETLKSAPFLSFNTQSSILPQQTMTDNQTQTMDLLHDLENILSGSLPGQALDNHGLLSETNTGAEAQLSTGSAQNTAIDFDIDEFFSASNIQTQTEESELGNMNSESLDNETQTDSLFSDSAIQLYSSRGNANFLGLEMFDTQTQTDLNFLFANSAHLPLGSILKQSSFSMSTDSSDTETQTEMPSVTKNVPSHSLESQVQLSSAETQTMASGLETLGNLFLTSNETQTAMDDFLLADLAWNTMDSHFSSVETQTCDELFSLFQTSDKSGS
ncbi:ATM interactor isoform X2 [Rhinatrema bivittatum]|uniref:ATM interactor isoform X2 n=1 Tax=Rhinatrema bivittatum TaxID=194408 RepID=UPI00112ECF78|nr:ATM interactor isoform X2 [Rhinatrema bivittatum]